jgi:peroxiredoxin
MIHRFDQGRLTCCPQNETKRFQLAARCALVALGVGCISPADREPQAVADTERFQQQIAITGARLDSVELVDVQGVKNTLRFAFSGPTVLVLFDEQDCLSCVNLAYEAWQADRWARQRNGRVVGIVTSQTLSLPTEYVRRTRLPFTLLVDTTGWSRRTFGMAAHPIMAFVSAEGTVMSTVLRTPRLTEQRLIPQFLSLLDAFPVNAPNHPR